ncbi:MAG: 2-oxoglutarate dehydrogenase E1 component [Gammaproteobacteria bacterium]|nr:MAG: 2-oxoglutarate dehydrogenase E1 component [Gammaproteobacteria bacterium]
MSETLMNRLQQSSLLGGGNMLWLESLYESWLANPDTVAPRWRHYFAGLPRVNGQDQLDVSHANLREEFSQLTGRLRGHRIASLTGSRLAYESKQVRVLQLINAYRFRGHQHARLDPLSRHEPYPIPELQLDYHQLSELDFHTVFQTGSLVGPEEATLEEILFALNRTYCENIGVEYMHITDTEEKRWIQQRLESVQSHPGLTNERRLWLLERLTAAEGIERYLHTKYVGQKRFSLEGGESLIPLLGEIIERGGSQGVREIVIGMSHRGRLNVLVNILGKSPAELFQEFEGQHEMRLATGDVKYHQGFSSDVRTTGGRVHLALAFNPSHLEIVSPVVQGSVRARQQRYLDPEGRKALAVVIHGDSAFAGQGVVMETFNMSGLRGFSTRGTVHVIINNQIGFTTSHIRDARSTLYCTDVAKMVNAPIFHVNGDDPEAVDFITRVALDYRMQFNKDVVIDLVCYRRHGHNEADEPAATQPLMYEEIQSLATTREQYAGKLRALNIISEDTPDELVRHYREKLDAGASVIAGIEVTNHNGNGPGADWRPYIGREWDDPCDTAADLETLRTLAARLQLLPKGLELNSRVAHILDERRKMAAGATPVDWGFAESLAFATLLHDGHPIRLSGQDCERGTFFHRHAVLHNQIDGETYVPLRNIAEKQPNFIVVDSLLSEEAVLAFEYGYATADPEALVIWEAQYGDFANVAQVVIDQFIASGEAKWGRLCGLVMFLPHGYEGQGPEHSSARLERFLQLCSNHNIQVCTPTTPAQMFHMLRRQLIRPFRRPLVVMTPKSLLRHKLATSSLDELLTEGFKPVIGEVDSQDKTAITRLVMCSGKVYYDLLERRREAGLDHVAILRLEQLYPFPWRLLRGELAHYPNVTEYVWCQEEPMNQGAWYNTRHKLEEVVGEDFKLHYTGREASPAPAVGYPKLHVQQQKALVSDALGIEND